MDDLATDIPSGRMSADEFLAWQEARGFEGRFELIAGEIVTMQSERNQHNAAKTEIIFQLRSQLPPGAPCRPYADGMAVKLPDDSVFEPDAMVRCGDPLGPEVVKVEDALIVIEVISPSNSRIEMTRKRVRYMSAPSIQHVVVISLNERFAVHDTRGPAPDRFLSQVYRAGEMRFDPPGLTLDLDAIFAAIDSA